MRSSPESEKVRGAFIRSKPNGALTGVVLLVILNNFGLIARLHAGRIHLRCALSTVDCGIDAHSGFDG